MVIQEIGSSSVIRPVQGGFLGEAAFDYAINAYVGCTFRCRKFCYAISFTGDQAPSQNGAPLDWGFWLKAKKGAGEAVARHTSLAGKAVYMSPATDPYLPQERKYELTRSILTALARHHAGVRLVVQTRGPLVVRDIRLLQVIRDQGDAQVNVTYSTDDEATRRRFEDAAPSLAQRRAAIAQLVSAGIRVVVTVTPFFPVTNVPAFAAQLLGMGLSGVVLQEFHPPARGAKIRSTQSGAAQELSAMGIDHASLARQMHELKALLEAGGLRVGVGNKGFSAPPAPTNHGPLFAAQASSPSSTQAGPAQPSAAQAGAVPSLMGRRLGRRPVR